MKRRRLLGGLARPLLAGVLVAGVLVAGVLVAGVLTSCRGRARSAAPASSGHREGTTAFRAMAAALEGGRRARSAAGDAGLRPQGPRLTATGLELLKARMPHDLGRSDVERFLEGRAVFGGALKRWVTALDGTDDAAVGAAFTELEEAYRGWYDAYEGLPPEREV